VKSKAWQHNDKQPRSSSACAYYYYDFYELFWSIFATVSSISYR